MTHEHNRNKRLHHITCVMLAMLWVLPATAQPAGQTPNDSTGSKKGELSTGYIDRSFGFSVDYPAGSTIVREKRLLAKADVEIVRFVQAEHIWSLVVRLSNTTRPLSAQTMLEGMIDNLKEIHPALKVIDAKTSRAGRRDGARLAISFPGARREWLRQQAVIPDKPLSYYTLILLTPLTDQAIANEVFDKIVGSFKLIRSETTQKRLNAALQKGRQLLRQTAANPEKLRIGEATDHYLRVVQNGEEIGFVQVRQTTTRLQGRSGTGVLEFGWLFNTDGSIRQMNNEMFLAEDLSFAKWENRLRFLNPIPNQKDYAVSVAMETGMQHKDKLLVAYSPKFNAPALQDKVLTVEPTFAGPAWFALFGKVANLNKPELYAFSAYDSDRRGLCLRTIEVGKPTQATIDGRSRAVIKLIGSEGLEPPFDETLVDNTGRIWKVTAGDMEMIATTADHVERMYKHRIAKAMAIFEKNPGKWPAPPKR